MSYSNYNLSQRINNVQQQINNFPSNNNTYSGTNTFNNDIRINSTLTDTSGDVGIAGQFLSSTGTGINWAYAGQNGYILYNLSSLPFTLPTTTYSNLYVLFEGTVGSGGVLTIPISGFTTGTFLTIKNISSGTINISTTSILFTTSSTSTGLIDIQSSETLSLYFNGSYWIQTSISNKIYRLTVTNSLSFSGAFATNTITESSSGTDIELYGTTASGDIYIGKILPNTKTVRICNTTSGTSGGSVHCCNVGFDASNINNATNGTTGVLKLGNSQTTGTLYIGGGSSTATRTSGPIIIGSDSTASGGINIGTGTDLAVPAASTVNIGSGTITTIIKGALNSVGNIAVTTASGTITAPSTGFLIGPYKNAATATASINTTGTITGTSLVLGTGNITSCGSINSTSSITGTSLVLGTGAITSCGTINASGLITADGGIQLPSGDTLNVLGSISGSGNITTSGDISVTGTGSISTAAGGSIETNAYESRTTTSNMTIGASMTNAANILIGANSLIKMKSPSITNTGSAISPQAATNMTIYGALMYSELTAAYTIPSNINRDFYVAAAGAGGYTITLPAVAIHQILHIRHYSASNVNLTTPLTTTKIYPIQGSIYTQTFNMTGNQVQNLYCNGTDWIGF